MKPLEIAKDIYSVGVKDWNVRNFHGYLTQRGSTYNAYLIIDEKVTLIDTVKAPFCEEFLERISRVIDLSKIDYVISNHVEQDHAGCMPQIMAHLHNATVLTTAAAEKEHKMHYDTSKWKVQTVKTGDTVSIGKRSLTFLTTPMVHWPDNMLTYCPEDKILFSNDAFGQHLAVSENFDDELSLDLILAEAKKYYANIVMPYSSQVATALNAAAGLDIKMIAPGHGMIWRKNIPAILENYTKWSRGDMEKKAVIVFDSMWHSTESIAYAVRNAFEQKDYSFRFFDLKANHISDVITDCLDAEYICVGSPTLNKNIMPSVAAMLTYIQGLICKGKKGVLFGSYGWAPLNMKFMQRYFDESYIETIAKYNINFVPTKEELAKITADLASKI